MTRNQDSEKNSKISPGTKSGKTIETQSSQRETMAAFLRFNH